MTVDGYPSEIVRESLLAHEGEECIFREKILICHARIEKIELSEWGMKIRLTDLHSPGFTSHRPEWYVSGNWESLGLKPDDEYWHATNVGWTIYLSTELTDWLVQSASAITETGYLERWRALCRLLDNYE